MDLKTKFVYPDNNLVYLSLMGKLALLEFPSTYYISFAGCKIPGSQLEGG